LCHFKKYGVQVIKINTLIIVLSIISLGQNVISINTSISTQFQYDIEEIKTINFVQSVSSINIDSDLKSLNVGESFKLSYFILPDNATNINVIWTSSNPDVATVNDDGLVEGISEGDVLIIAETEDGSHTDEISIKVELLNSVQEFESDIFIFPNPTSDFINIELPTNLNFGAIISDLNGNIHFSDYDVNQIDISNLSLGVYLLTLNINNEFYQYKIIKD
jgi:hypothetical protein